jgi:hypothetical protein
MNRKEYLEKSLKLGLCTCTFMLTGVSPSMSGKSTSQLPDDELDKVRGEKEFIQNWLSDLLDTMDKELNRNVRIKLYEGCGKGCFNRYKFKQDIAADGKGDIDRLISAYKRNFEVWRDGEKVHIRYGEKSSRCYCPAAQFKPVKPQDLHCECTKATHRSIFETALGRPIMVEIVETLRRNGQTCHFIAHLDT